MICTSIFGHRFEPRYSYSEPQGHTKINFGSFEAANTTQLETYLRAYQPKTYHGDICVRCGDWREPPQVVCGSDAPPIDIGDIEAAAAAAGIVVTNVARPERPA